MEQFLNTPIKFVKGVGPAKESSFKTELGIYTLGDLLYYFPFRYVDRSKIYSIREIREDMPFVQIKGKLSNLQTLGSGRSSRLSVMLHDESGQIELVWFAGIKWIRERLVYGKEYIVFGRPALFNRRFNITHPEIEVYDSEKGVASNIKLQPFYNSTEKLAKRGLDSKGLAKIIYAALQGATFSRFRSYCFSNSVYSPSTFLVKFLFVVTKLSFTTLKASKISFDTFRANIAVSTKYIIAIIFCRGVSLNPAINYLFFSYN